jgi:hypothetical protein
VIHTRGIILLSHYFFLVRQQKTEAARRFMARLLPLPWLPFFLFRPNKSTWRQIKYRAKNYTQIYNYLLDTIHFHGVPFIQQKNNTHMYDSFIHDLIYLQGALFIYIYITI